MIIWIVHLKNACFWETWTPKKIVQNPRKHLLRLDSDFQIFSEPATPFSNAHSRSLPIIPYRKSHPYTKSLFFYHKWTWNLNVQPILLGVTFSKAQSSKLESLFCHDSVKRDVRALSFELWISIRKSHHKRDWLYSPFRGTSDETRNGHRNAKQNPNLNHETIRDLGVRGASIVRCGHSCLVDLNWTYIALRFLSWSRYILGSGVELN